MLAVLHGSDLHFGRFHDPGAARAFLAAIEAARPGLIVLSGDLTQRAKVREYRAARAFLGRLPRVPVVLTPGNHDVPLYRVLERWLGPYRNYRRHIGPEGDAVTRVPGATVVALNSTAPWRAVVQGRIDGRQVRFAGRAFGAAAGEDLRILVAHHPLAATPGRDTGRPVPGAAGILAALDGMGVDLVLGGHLHRAYAARARAAAPDGGGSPRALVVQCGTTTSFRGRGEEARANSFNLIRAGRGTLEVTRFLRGPGEAAFAPAARERFPRARRRAPPRAPAPRAAGEASR